METDLWRSQTSSTLEKILLVFVDGPPHDKDYVKKDDEAKRDELKAMGYRVFSISYNSFDIDLNQLKNALGS